MYTGLATVALVSVLIKIFHDKGGFREIGSFGLSKDRVLISSIVSNIIVVIMFAEIYWALDQDESEEHFGFESKVDAYYFSTVTSSSVGYGDILPMSKSAKVLNIVHIFTMFFVILPIVFEALKPGN